VGKFGENCFWSQAADLCSNFLKTADLDRQVVVNELLGDCLYYASFQQSSRSEFKAMILRAKDAFGAAVLDAELDSSFARRCSARAAYCLLLATDDEEQRRRIVLYDCIVPLRKVCAELSEDPASKKQLMKVEAEYLRYLLVGCHTIRDSNLLARLVDEAKIVGRNAFRREIDSEDLENFVAVANAYVLFLEWASGYFLDESEFRVISEEVASKKEQLIEISRSLKNKQLASMALETAASIMTEFKFDFELGISLLQSALAIAEQTKDSLLIGRQLASIANASLWAQQDEDLPEKRRELLNRAIEHSSGAIKALQTPLAMYYLTFAYSLYVCSLTELAKNEADLSMKLKLLSRAVEEGKRGMNSSNASSIDFLLNRLSDALRYRADLSDNSSEIKPLLLEALAVIDAQIERTKTLASKDSWNLGLAYRDAGVVYGSLSELETGTEKNSLLSKSITSLETSVEMLAKSPRLNGQEASICLACEALADSLVQRYELSGDSSDCLGAIEQYEQSVRYYEKMKDQGSMAHLTVYLLSKAAMLYDRIGEYESSSICFNKANEACIVASGTESESFQKSFLGLATWASACARVEEARLLHRDEKYSQAIAKLRDASIELEKTDGYRYLSRHYLALSLAEEGEEHSRNEKNAEAAQAFEKASNLFSQSQDEILQSVDKMPSLVSDKVKTWADFSKQRSKYCLGRKTLAIAKSLDIEGQAEESMYKYRTAAKIFRELEEGSGEDSQEFEALAISCDAWATMKEAEYRSSSELYTKAGALFMLAKDKKVKRSFVLSCLASAAICRALEAGTKFKQSRQIQLYSEIKQQLGIAAQYYDEGGFDIASDWTSATEALFDAFAYLSSAESEMDPEKKTQMYHLAEKHLDLSAKRYGDIGFEKKRQEVLKQLKKVKENKLMLLTPVEALSQNPTSYSTPVSFVADQGVGFERFEGSNVTGNVSCSMKMVNVGGSVRLDVDIANVGRSPVLLMKLDNLAPEQSFEPETEKETHHFFQSKDGISIDLKGRRLDYLKTLEMAVHLKAKSKGTFELKPKISYVDESGKYKAYEFELLKLDVKELGFLGWAKGNQ
jgi:hypothetical protein